MILDPSQDIQALVYLFQESVSVVMFSFCHTHRVQQAKLQDHIPLTPWSDVVADRIYGFYLSVSSPRPRQGAAFVSPSPPNCYFGVVSSTPPTTHNADGTTYLPESHHIDHPAIEPAAIAALCDTSLTTSALDATSGTAIEAAISLSGMYHSSSPP